MKIAVACEGSSVSQHFGYCEGFAVYTTENDAVISQQFAQNPGHRPGFLPKHLHSLGVDVIIAGGMGGNAIAIFNEHGIEVITGAAGKADDAVRKYLDGELESTGSVCHEHQHHGTCS